MNYICGSLKAVVVLAIAMLFSAASDASAQEVRTRREVREFMIMKDSVVEVPYQRLPREPYDTLRVKSHWRQLKRYMTEKQVTKLLGLPKVSQMDGENALNYWWYGSRAVVFNALTRRVSGWDK